MEMQNLDISRADIKKLEKEQLEGSLSYLADLAGIECYCEEEEEVVA